ncbi:MAG: hypothetical protein AAGJ18_17840, partial [Bacteroidota bacterium]
MLAENHFLRLTFIALILLAVAACGSGDEDISGCANPDATNFLSTATVDDGSCTFLRDSYLGNYNVTTSDCAPSGDFYENITIQIAPNDNSSDGVDLTVNGFTPAATPIVIMGKVDDSG